MKEQKKLERELQNNEGKLKGFDYTTASTGMSGVSSTDVPMDSEGHLIMHGLLPSKPTKKKKKAKTNVRSSSRNVSPNNTETDVFLGSIIIVTFDQAIDVSTVNESTFSLTGTLGLSVLWHNNASRARERRRSEPPPSCVRRAVPRPDGRWNVGARFSGIDESSLHAGGYRCGTEGDLRRTCSLLDLIYLSGV
jgi:hypothetical protein